jgi:hypothetical protein
LIDELVAEHLVETKKSEKMTTIVVKLNAMTTNKQFIPKEILESELARLRAKHHCRDGARVLNDAVPYFDPGQKAVYNSIAAELAKLEKRLAELEPNPGGA